MQLVRSAFAPDFKELDENVDYEERESEFDLEDEDKSVQLNEEHKDVDVEVSYLFANPVRLGNFTQVFSRPSDLGWSQTVFRSIIP